VTEAKRRKKNYKEIVFMNQKSWD